MDSFDELFDLIGELSRRRYQAAERAFAALGLNHTEARLLTLLDRAGGMQSQEVLSGQISVDRSNVGRALKGLEARGLIERRKDAVDKRTNVVAITGKGRESVAGIIKTRAEIASRFFGEMNEEEARGILETFSKAIGRERDT